MQRFIAPLALVALASRALAGPAIVQRGADDLSFVDGDWEDKCVGENFPIKWSKGNGKNLALTVKCAVTGWEQEICDSEVAPGGLDWIVEVPKCDAEYSIWIQQEECEALESPKFTVNCVPDVPSTVTSTAGNWSDWSAPKPTAKPDHDWEDSDVTTTVTDPGHVWSDSDVTTTDPKPNHVWSDSDVTTTDPKPNHVWSDSDVTTTVTDPNHVWSDSSVPTTDPKPDHVWSDSSVPTTDPKPEWSDSDPADPKKPAPAAATSAGWKAPAAASSPVSPVSPISPVSPVSPAVAKYTGAASKMTGSAFGLVAIFAAALAL